MTLGVLSSLSILRGYEPVSPYLNPVLANADPSRRATGLGRVTMSGLHALHAYLVLTPLLLALLASVSAQTNPFTWSGVRYDCKCTELDSCWPSTSVWSQLNATVGGNLQKVRNTP